MSSAPDDRWHSGAAYERYMGRWSRKIAVRFLDWLDPAPKQTWLDAGCGTGALTTAILETADPAEVVGIDPALPFIASAQSAISDPRATFQVGDVQSLPFDDARFDAAVSGLCLNFVPDPGRAVTEMSRVTRPGGVVGAYVWDYAGGMQMLRKFWDAARTIDPVLAVDEAHRNPLCAPEPLKQLFAGSGLSDVQVGTVETETRFRDFDDYWGPFEGGTGPAPAYLKTLSPDARAALASELRRILPTERNGSIVLMAKAIAVKGHRPRTDSA